MNTLVKNLLSVSAFIFAIGAAFASATVEVGTRLASGIDPNSLQCVQGTVSASCTLAFVPNGVTCTLIENQNVKQSRIPSGSSTPCTGAIFQRPPK